MKKIVLILVGLFFFSSLSFAEETPPENIVKEYIKELYNGYLACEPRDISSYLDMDVNHNQNFAQGYKFLNVRRAYIKEKDYCYVETNAYPLEVEIEGVTFIDENSVQVSFDLRGDKMLAYPPFFYLGKNYFTLVKKEDGWKIHGFAHEDVRFHYEDERLSVSNAPFEKDVEEMKKNIDKEFRGVKMPLFDPFFPAFGSKTNPLNYGYKDSDYPYDNGRALKYIENHIYSVGEGFIRLQENCANFSSQVLYRGFFGEEEVQTEEWYGLHGDLSHCWIYAGDVYDYMIRPRFSWEVGARSEVPGTIYGLRQGGIIEVKGDPAESWAHVMQLKDYQKMIFSGNNYDGFRFYSDLTSIKRFFNPLYFRIQ